LRSGEKKVEFKAIRRIVGNDFPFLPYAAALPGLMMFSFSASDLSLI
jgi:hypothetical protein